MFCGKCGTKIEKTDKFCPKCGASSSEVIKASATSGKIKIASKSKRLRALFWDLFLPVLPMVILSAVYAVFQVVMVFFALDTETNPLNFIFVIAGIVSFVWIFVYWILCLLQINKTGQSIGKKRVGVKVVEAETGKTSSLFKYLASRVVTPVIATTFAAIFPIFYLAIIADFLWVLFDKRNQSIHDKLWGTLVVEV